MRNDADTDLIEVKCSRPSSAGKNMLKSQEEHLLNQGLYLHNLNISDIAVDTFSSLPNLDEIYIDDNKINILRSEVFRGASSKLWKLGLSNNSISVLESGMFNGLKLSFLDLDHNPLTNVTSESFFGLSGFLLWRSISRSFQHKSGSHSGAISTHWKTESIVPEP